MRRPGPWRLAPRWMPGVWIALAVGVAGVAGVGVSGCGDDGGPPAARLLQRTEPLRSASVIGPGPHDVAVLDMGELGEIRIELLPELAPKSVAQFRKLAAEGFYDGTYFHRVIPGFMIQGGDPLTLDLDPRNDGKGNSGSSVVDEFSDYEHVRGTVSMANGGYPRTASSQFFIVHQDVPELDGRYTVFGRVVSGMEVVDAITELELDTYGRYGPTNRPYPVSATIEGVRIEEAPAGDRPAVAAADPSR